MTYEPATHHAEPAHESAYTTERGGKPVVPRPRMVDIIAGGMTGAEQAALFVARDLGLGYGGACPVSKEADGQPIPKECGVSPDAASWGQAISINVREATGVIVFGYAERTHEMGHARLALRRVAKLGKPLIHVRLPSVRPSEISPGKILVIREWMQKIGGAIYVTGPKERTAPGIGAAVERILRRVFTEEVR